MKVKLFGGAKTVTGSCFGISTGKTRILIDCGMFQGSKALTARNYHPFGFDPQSYHALLLTHAHLDHCGRIPLLVREGFAGTIYATAATKDIAEIVMLDAASVSRHDVELENKRRMRLGLPPREPIYTEDDVRRAMRLFKTVAYHQPFAVGEGMTATFYDAGHILGAAIIGLAVCEKGVNKNVVFSGDIGQLGTPIVRDTDYLQTADFVFIESTYGDRLHPPFEKRKQLLLDVIHEAIGRKAKVLVPSFAVERTQELLYDLNELVEKKLVPKIPVYVDSPMGIKVTEVFRRHTDSYNDAIKEIIRSGDNPFSFPGLTFTPRVEDSIKLNGVPGPCIIIAGSGMCTGGRIKHHIKHNIWKEQNIILFIGYQAEGTLGYYIKRGEKVIRLLGTEVAVKAKVMSIDSFSAHADYRQLIHWLSYFKPRPKTVFIVHGEEQAMLPFAERIHKLGIATRIPEMGEELVI